MRSSKPIRNRYRQEGSSNINYTRPSENSRHVVFKYRKPVYNDFEYTITNIRRNLSLGQMICNVNDELAYFNHVLKRNYELYAPLVIKRVRSQCKVP